MKFNKAYKKWNRFFNISIILAIIGMVYLIQSIIYFKPNFLILLILGSTFLIIDYIYILEDIKKTMILKR